MMDDPMTADREHSAADEVHPIERDTQKIMMNCSVPLQDRELLESWNETCKPEVPEGFGDYRWAKIWHDHKFTQNFKQALEGIQTLLVAQQQILATLNKELQEIKTHLKKADSSRESYSEAGTFG